jgi:DNA-binding response OmpR family regulator
MKRILIVEDTIDFADALQRNLEDEGYFAEISTRGAEALARLAVAEPDLVVLDRGLPDRDGLEVLRVMRQRGCTCPVLILTARGHETDTVEGFRAGADDYVTKPFRLRELLARIEALLRRTVTAGIAKPTMAGEMSDDELRATFGLTERQVSVTRLLGEGYGNDEIARLLEISPLTARNHTEQVFRKLGVSSRARVGAVIRRRS